MMIKVAVFAVISCLIAVSFRKENEHISVAVLIAASIVIAAFVLSHFASDFKDIAYIYTSSGGEYAYLKILLKCLGISLISELAADICRDASYTAFATQIIMGGKMAVITMSLPMIKAVLEMCVELIKK